MAGAMIGLAVAAAVGGPAQAAGDLAVADGLSVTLEYTLSLPDRTRVESNVGQPPLTFVQGSHHLVPGLEKAIEGMKAGQTKHVEVPAELAYGVYDPEAKLKVPKNRVPPTVKVGDVLTRPSDRRPMKVVEITDQTVILDTNHPLAGKDLVIDVKILKVEKPAGKP
jgi:FKBP-type peptidyl-prolyl cis-trans isomerase 2